MTPKAAAQDVVECLKTHGFVVHLTSFDELTTGGGLHHLKQTEPLPACETARLLRSFPDYLAVHRTMAPDKGVIFVVVADERLEVTAEADGVYRAYFPDRMLLVAPTHEELMGRWYHSAGPAEALPELLKRYVRP
jgi:hypothetical protein